MKNINNYPWSSRSGIIAVPVIVVGIAVVAFIGVTIGATALMDSLKSPESGSSGAESTVVDKAVDPTLKEVGLAPTGRIPDRTPLQIKGPSITSWIDKQGSSLTDIYDVWSYWLSNLFSTKPEPIVSPGEEMRDAVGAQPEQPAIIDCENKSSSALNGYLLNIDYCETTAKLPAESGIGEMTAPQNPTVPAIEVSGSKTSNTGPSYAPTIGSCVQPWLTCVKGANGNASILESCDNGAKACESKAAALAATAGNACFSSDGVFQKALSAFENTLAKDSAYEKALSSYADTWSAYNSVRGTPQQSTVSYPTFTQAAKDVSSAYRASSDAYDVLIEAYETNISKCAQLDADKADACIDKYDQATLNCLSEQDPNDDRCYIDASKAAIQTCFR